MKKRIKLTAIAAGAVLLLLGAGYTVFIAPKLQREKWVYIESKVERGPLSVGVTESGSLEFGIKSVLYDLDLTIDEDDGDDEEDSEDDGEETTQKYLKVEEVCVAAGQKVQSGDALIKFTAESVDGVRKLLQSALVDAKAACQEAESEYDLAVLEAKTKFEAKKVSQQYASAFYKNAGNSVDDEIAAFQTEITQRTNNVSLLEKRIAEAEKDYQEALEAYESAQKAMDSIDTGNAANFLTVQTEYLNAQTKYQTAEKGLKQAREELENNASEIQTLQRKLSDASAREKLDKLEVKENYQESVMNGENAQITYDAELENLKSDLQEAVEDREKIEKQMEAFEAFVGEDGVLYAGENGMITEVGYEAGDRLIQEGTAVAYATPDAMTVTVDVTQEDVVSLQVGNPVEIQFAAYPDRIYKGSIVSVHTTATSGESAAVSYEVVVGVEGDTDALYGGMTADITFVTEEKEDVLYVSRKAIVEQDGKTFVYVQNGNQKELTEVRTGIRNSTSAEILSGLEEGDIIYIASRVSSEEAVEQTAEQNQGSAAADGEMGGMPSVVRTPSMGAATSGRSREGSVSKEKGNFEMPEREAVQ